MSVYILTQLAAPGVRRGINPPARPGDYRRVTKGIVTKYLADANGGPGDPDTPGNPPGSVICNWQTGDILIGRYTTAAALSGLLPQADELVSETDDAAGPN